MDEDKYTCLLRRLSETDQRDYPQRSRMHLLRSFPGKCYVKRDDELGFGASGSKIRKYRTLIPYLKKMGVQTAIVIGGAYSNNVVGLTQFLIEEGIKPLLFLRGSQSTSVKGNHLLIRMLCGKEPIHWISKEDWPNVLSLAEEEVKRLQHIGMRAMIIPEGAVHSSAIPGAATLAVDIVRNMKESGIKLNHLFLDSGTGLTAVTTLIAFSWLRLEIPVTVTMVAGDAGTFQDMLMRGHHCFQEWLQKDVEYPSNFNKMCPVIGKSFGSVSSGVIDRSLKIASEDGIFADLTYTTKHFETVRETLNKDAKNEPLMIVHSGGATSLSGFQEKLVERMSL